MLFCFVYSNTHIQIYFTAFCQLKKDVNSFSPTHQPSQYINVYIYITLCKPQKVLATASSCFWDQYERPIAGYIDFCLSAISFSEDGNIEKYRKKLKLAIGTAIHELAHVLGVTSDDILFFHDWTTGQKRTEVLEERLVPCVGGGLGQEQKYENMYMPSTSVLDSSFTKKGELYYEIKTSTIQNVIRNHFNCSSLNGARLENQPTNGNCIGEFVLYILFQFVSFPSF